MSGDADPIGALIAVATADSDTAALAGAHIYGGELPAAVTKDMPLNALVLQPSGGPAPVAGYANVAKQRIDLFAYGATPFEADQLRRCAARAFRQLRRSIHADVLIHWIDPAGGYFAARDPDATWPRAFQSFSVFHALEAIE